MKKSLLLTVELIRQLGELSKSDQADALLALLEFCRVFGKPHLHTGLSIRKLREKDFECRAGLRWRLIVRDTPEIFWAWFIGSHDEIRRVLRERQY